MRHLFSSLRFLYHVIVQLQRAPLDINPTSTAFYSQDTVYQMLQNLGTCTFTFNSLYLCSTRYFFIQHFIFVFNNTHFLSTSTKIIFTQQKYLFNFNQNYFHSTITARFSKISRFVRCEQFNYMLKAEANN